MIKEKDLNTNFQDEILNKLNYTEKNINFL
jgi:hypothetical protein